MLAALTATEIGTYVALFVTGTTAITLWQNNRRKAAAEATKAEAEAEKADAEAGNVLVATAGDVVGMLRDQMQHLQAEIVDLRGRVSVQREDLRRGMNALEAARRDMADARSNYARREQSLKLEIETLRSRIKALEEYIHELGHTPPSPT